MTDTLQAGPRPRLNRARVLEAAVALADEIGIESLSMRRLAQELGVVPMALYKHVANKEELLDGMVDVIVGEIDPPAADADWKSGVRSRILSARHTLQRHAWARRAIETRTAMTPRVLDYMDSFVGVFLTGGLSLDLTHHAMHALGGRVWGFTQELFEDPAAPAPAVSDADRAEMLRQAAQRYPNVVAIATSVTHDEGSVVGHGCDDQFEFEFALDLLLDGFERLHARGWTSRGAKTQQSNTEAAKTAR
ncbi:TetR family transcriptional regulator [Arthrobacter crusticola]|uniref:TetR family transcriptional regulator n=1 Tax=Arthrobacter crusticola TaxID=2547960 RepID=A0A4R5TWC0_9MICC|nr:TetR/AcrR family transcriptional regulator C-terminal domain-containing protein [Arthrobacter crusticola]TDK25437.1 TetR family transcriptional regulator [Arthrobacter crusticola]